MVPLNLGNHQKKQVLISACRVCVWSRSRGKNHVRRVCPGVAPETPDVEDKHIGDGRVGELIKKLNCERDGK